MKHLIYFQVFYEIQYFDDVNLMNEHLIGNPRDALQTALQNPNSYLQVKIVESIHGLLTL